MRARYSAVRIDAIPQKEGEVLRIHVFLNPVTLCPKY